MCPALFSGIGHMAASMSLTDGGTGISDGSIPISTGRRQNPRLRDHRGLRHQLPMDIAELITPDSVIANLRVASKKQALQELARRAAHVVDLHERRILEVLVERERLGSTGLGSGVAIPHGKLPELRRLHGVFSRLERPGDFAAGDDRPVDLIFAFLAPEKAGPDHLKALARISPPPPRPRR